MYIVIASNLAYLFPILTETSHDLSKALLNMGVVGMQGLTAMDSWKQTQMTNRSGDRTCEKCISSSMS